jgi:iron complex outermembrane receptor protein
MLTRHFSRARHIRWLATSTLALAVAQPAFAQEAATNSEDVIVTASRIQSSGFTAPTPTTVLSGAQIEATAPTIASEVLALVPSFRTTGQPASATVYANLRGIGSQRTLLLVNGRRHVPTFSDGTVDLGVIPTILISRSEVVTGGASASWGSDAVAGVINLILKNDLEGLNGTAQAGISDYGDGDNFMGSLAFGSRFGGGRGHILIGGEYSRDDGIRSLQGPYRSRPWTGRGSLGNSAFATNKLPGTIYGEDIRRADVSEGGLITSGPLRGLNFLPGGATSRFGFGQVFGNNMIGGTDNEGDAPTPGGDLKMPFERWTLMGRASYDISDSLNLFIEGTYASVLSRGLGQPARNNGAVTGNPSCTTTNMPTALGSIVVPITNPYLSQAVRDQMTAAGVSCFNMGRVFRDPGMGDFTVADGSPSIFRGVVGLEGSIGSDWKWDAYYQYGRNRFEQARIGNINVANFRRAIDAVDLGGGRIVCRVNADASTANDDPACHPFNLFGNGSPSIDSIGYVAGTSFFQMITKQQVAAASANGPLFDLWAGPLSVATGAEWRREEIDAVADPISQANGWQTSNRKAIKGDYEVKEVFGEVALPLLRDSPLARSLDLSVAARYTDYSSSGGVTTWKVGGTWDVNETIRLRATRSRDIRAGNLGELFTPTAVLTTNVRDPRDASTTPVPVTTRGNAQLAPEKADTWTAGIVLQPQFLSGFRFSVDYYQIEIAGQIGTIAANDVAERCFTDKLAQFCDLVTLGSANQITGVTVRFENLDRYETRGLDIEASYRLPVSGLFGSSDGDMTFRVLANYVDKLATTAASGATTTDPAGQYNSPHWTVFGMASYTGRRFSSALDLRWYGGGTVDNTRVPGAIAANGINLSRVSSTLYTNITMTMDVSPNADKRLELFGRVSNLTNTPPPYPATGEGRTLFDPTGRAYRVGVRFKL